MGRYLVVANQTLGGKELDDTVRDRIGRGDARFFIVVPMTSPRQEAADWTRGFPVGGGGTALDAPPGSPSPFGSSTPPTALGGHRGGKREAMLDDARARAERRLDQMIAKIRAAGGEADGTVGAADPAEAVREVLQDRSFDEVIVSTLPARISRWVKMDLPSRVARMTDAPVTTLEAEG